jgi:hypothetical protein
MSEQEPIAWLTKTVGGDLTVVPQGIYTAFPAYASPQPAQPGVPVDKLKDLLLNYSMLSYHEPDPNEFVRDLQKLIAAHDGKGE